MSFSADVSAFATKTGIKLDQVVRKVVFDMTSAMVMMTPVGDPTFWKHPAPPGYTGGHARSNYFWGVQRVGTIDPTKSTNGAPSLNRAAAFSTGLKAGGVVYLTNNLPYIMALEFGHSERQAPAGMARITVDRWQHIVNIAVQGVR